MSRYPARRLSASAMTEKKDHHEQRSEPRVSVRRTINVLPCRAGKQWGFTQCELVDASPQGVGLILKDPLEREQQFLLKVKIGGKVQLLLYTVHNCVEWQRGKWRVGARFSGFAAQQVEADPNVVLDALMKDE